MRFQKCGRPLPPHGFRQLNIVPFFVPQRVSVHERRPPEGSLREHSETLIHPAALWLCFARIPGNKSASSHRILWFPLAQPQRQPKRECGGLSSRCGHPASLNGSMVSKHFSPDSPYALFFSFLTEGPIFPKRRFHQWCFWAPRRFLQSWKNWLRPFRSKTGNRLQKKDLLGGNEAHAPAHCFVLTRKTWVCLGNPPKNMLVDSYNMCAEPQEKQRSDPPRPLDICHTCTEPQKRTGNQNGGRPARDPAKRVSGIQIQIQIQIPDPAPCQKADARSSPGTRGGPFGRCFFLGKPCESEYLTRLSAFWGLWGFGAACREGSRGSVPGSLWAVAYHLCLFSGNPFVNRPFGPFQSFDRLQETQGSIEFAQSPVARGTLSSL